MKVESVIAGFAKAGLVAVPMKRPMFMGPDARSAFFLRVARNRNKVWYEFWPGNDENKVQVLNADPNLRQLVLLVNEPGGKFHTMEWDYKARKRKKVTHTISPQTRRFLVGFDERDLFMAQLPDAARITTVAQAHAVLRTPGMPDKTVRQGEWFFYPATAEEKKEIERLKLAILKKARIGGRGGGKPHTADEYLSLSPASNRWGVQDEGMFVRGKVRHLDHATVEFRDWHRVVRNTENRGSNSRWID